MQAKNVATADEVATHEPVLLVDAISTMQNELKYKEYRLNGSVLVASTALLVAMSMAISVVLQLMVELPLQTNGQIIRVDNETS